MEVIKATLDELDLVAPLFDAYRVFYGQASDLDIARGFIQARLENQESVIFLAVGSNGEALGFTQLYPSFSSVSAARTWILNDLYVADTARKQGVATQLMGAAKKLAVEGEVKGLALETAEDNVNAQKLYESLGYKKELGAYHYFLDISV